MNKYILTLAALTAALSAGAQTVYDLEKFASTDLNGTARFVGMAGAMNALGADLSTMSGNPAAMGLYRRSDVAVSFSVQNQQNAVRFGEQSPTQMSFDQAGMVYTFRTGTSNVPYFTIGFNYQRSRNFKQYLGTPEGLPLDGRSLTYQLGQHLYFANPSVPGFINYNSIISNGALDAGLLGIEYDADGNPTRGILTRMGDTYSHERASWGYLSEYDVNFAFNVKDRFYVGATLGAYNLRYGTNMYYVENFAKDPDVPTEPAMSYDYSESRLTRGSGIDFKLGMIVRPIEESPFRFGLAFHTPRMLSLTQQNYGRYNTSASVPYDTNPNLNINNNAELSSGAYDYSVREPWRLQVSAATTFGGCVAVDAEYEAQFNKGCGVKYPYYDFVFPRSGMLYSGTTDEHLYRETSLSLATQHTVRLGLEACVAKQFFVRAGYNFVSSPFSKDAMLNYAQPLNGDVKTNVAGNVTWVDPSFRSSYNCTSTDYVNLGATHRVGLGLGWHSKMFYADVAYALSSQKAESYAFSDCDYDYDNPNSSGTYNLTTLNQLPAYSTNLVRHSVQFTLGLKF